MLSFSVLYGLMVAKYALICAMEIPKIQVVVHILKYKGNGKIEISVIKTRTSSRRLFEYFLPSTEIIFEISFNLVRS